jgi:hypothetical protein
MNMKIKRSALAGTLYAAVLGMVLSGCSQDEASSSAASVSLSTALSSALSYMNDTLPNLGNSVGAPARVASARLRTPTTPPHASVASPTLNLIYTSDWAGTSFMTEPPGGALGASEPNYGGSALPATVNYRDHLKMALDAGFERASDRTYRPTLFGRMDNLLDIMVYMAQTSIPKDADGLPTIGTHSSPLTVDGITLTIDAEVSTPSDLTYYDKRLYLKGSAGGSVQFQNLIWIRSNSNVLNLMQVDLQDRWDTGGASQGQDGTPDRISFNVIQWNRSTGKLAFEHHTGADDTTGAFEHYRYLIESSSGKQYFYSLQDQNGEGKNYMQIALYSPTATSTQGSVSIRESRIGGSSNEIRLGNLCVGFAGGSGVSADTDLSGEASGGTCSGHTDAINTKTGIMGAIFTLVGYTTWSQSATNKGFPTSDWSSSSNREAWLNAGDLVSASFNTRAEFISRYSSKPAN